VVRSGSDVERLQRAVQLHGNARNGLDALRL